MSPGPRPAMIEISHLHLKTPIICACVNHGYASGPLMRNFVQSIYRIGRGEHLLLAALDDGAFSILKTLHGSVLRWNATSLPTPTEESILFRKFGWKAIVFSKIALVRELAEQNVDILFSDVDVIFIEDPLPLLLQLNVDDFAFQSDVSHGGNWREPSTLCSGLYFARPTQAVQKTLSLTASDLEHFAGDQPFLRHRLGNLKTARYLMLDPEFFPNGNVWAKSPPDNPVAIHFNYIVGEHKKADAMKRAGLWLLD